MPELFSREYAEKIGEALDRSTATAVARAFQTTLHRKLGRINTPVPDLDSPHVTDEQKFEYLFDSLFNVVPEKKPLSVLKVRDIFQEALEALQERARENTGQSKQLYLDDAADYEAILELLGAGDERAAAQKYMLLDTAAREYANGETPAEDYQFALWLDQYDDDKPNGLPNVRLMGYEQAAASAI
jgi:hypothetical protein